ncbi:hypothetical protein [Micromonospora sp. HM5-17]|uniref:hypothetical protein n=1 Tax=Micromonospora sp. HM5-17 TaxID=2487710 RepID=UPI000F47487E|nr:hypothetical protein [Micromonospora sp. HM5-17]ROT27188.1 hypothetical protein EF879_23325 [Micromonospora sp. HM5-17]
MTVDLEETDADRAFEARPGCCADCDEMLAEAGDLSEYERELARRRRTAWRRAVAVARWVAEARRARLRALHVDYRRRRAR